MKLHEDGSLMKRITKQVRVCPEFVQDPWSALRLKVLAREFLSQITIAGRYQRLETGQDLAVRCNFQAGELVDVTAFGLDAEHAVGMVVQFLVTGITRFTDTDLGIKTVSTEVTIQNKLGLHARPCLRICDAAAQYLSDILVRNAERIADAKSAMQMGMLAATCGDTLHLKAYGPDAEEAIETLVRCLNSLRDEDT